MFACLSVCPFACLKNHTSKFSVAVALPSDDNAIRNVLPVLWKTSRFRILSK